MMLARLDIHDRNEDVVNRLHHRDVTLAILPIFEQVVFPIDMSDQRFGFLSDIPQVGLSKCDSKQAGTYSPSTEISIPSKT
jgi:hypothetical protein